MNQSAMLADLVRQTDIDVVMLAGRYTLLEQDALDDLLPLCCERRVAVVAAGVFNSGLLARARPPTTPSTTTRTRRGRSSGERKRSPAFASGTGRPCRRRPLRFRSPTEPSRAFASGRDRRSRCAGTRHSLAEAIAPDLWSELKAEGLLRGDAPVPD